jgi:hypothetical protein
MLFARNVAIANNYMDKTNAHQGSDVVLGPLNDM